MLRKRIYASEFEIPGMKWLKIKTCDLQGEFELKLVWKAPLGTARSAACATALSASQQVLARLKLSPA